MPSGNLIQRSGNFFFFLKSFRFPLEEPSFSTESATYFESVNTTTLLIGFFRAFKAGWLPPATPLRLFVVSLKAFRIFQACASPEISTNTINPPVPGLPLAGRPRRYILWSHLAWLNYNCRYLWGKAFIAIEKPESHQTLFSTAVIPLPRKNFSNIECKTKVQNKQQIILSYQGNEYVD